MHRDIQQNKVRAFRYRIDSHLQMFIRGGKPIECANQRGNTTELVLTKGKNFGSDTHNAAKEQYGPQSNTFSDGECDQ
jgi:hypothetical protein